ncbi:MULTISPECIES: LPS export ABC transporter periplasmic protein LptC [Nitrincola]|uniref:LPS export ABC transporter periplasmic protein LptC n=1 Tax=Nitrincola nitratireducens TaxID=1229521 RepID=W9V736_9GAMM|nr:MULTISPECIES: LPS export ABC transporter periplasmic protein LptC [Nitrincola]EXJ12721.1 hypothetical protein D791_00062 [Nitrincola nitratireducens]
MRWTRHFALAVVILLTLIPVLYWGWMGINRPVLEVSEPNEDRVDFFILDGHLKRYSQSGELVHQLSSPLIEHLPGPSITQVTQPKVILIGTGDKETHIKADKGTMTDDESKIELAGNVRVIDNSSFDAPRELRTETMTLFPSSQYAETADPVMVVQAFSQLSAIGMQAWLGEQRIELLSEVRGYYAKSE